MTFDREQGGMTILLWLLVLFAIYTCIITGGVVILSGLGVPSKWRILSGFLIFGIAAGMLATWQWPSDIIFMYNFPAAFLGNEGYVRSIQYLGDPYASNAHETIPWFLRIPQIFVIVSVVFWGLTGVLVQLAINRRWIPRQRGVEF